MIDSKDSAMRLLLISGLACLPSLAQSLYPCQASPALEKFHQALYSAPRDQRARMAREKLQQDPGNLFLHRWYLETVTGAVVADEYKTLLDQHPGDAAYLFLYGRALRMNDPARAMEYLEQALRKEPRLPWAHIELAQMYLARKPKAEPKAIDHLNAFIQICPQNPDAYIGMRNIDDRYFLVDGARRLRFLLGDRIDGVAALYFPALWSAELRIAAAEQKEGVRSLINADIDRLKDADPAIRHQGYLLLADAPGPVAAKVEASPDTAAEAVREWHVQHPHPKAGDRAAHKKYYQAQLKAADEWIKKYPGEFTPLHERFVALDMLDASKSDLEAAGDALIRNEDKRTSIAGSSVRVHVAEVWLRHRIRVSEIPAIVEKGIERTQRPEGWNVIADAYLELDKPFKAREALDRMQEWLEKYKSSRPASYAANEGRYYLAMAKLAEKQGNKLDALTYYERAIATHHVNPTEQAHKLWNELGGTNEGWLTFSNPPLAGTIAPGSTAPRATSRAQVGKPLPAMSLKDFEGKTWTVASFQGKTTLINVWATWCGPCQRELPFLQKLYDKITNESDLQVLTLNVDEEVDKVQPYLKKYKYTFPVLPAHTYVRGLLPNLSIPRNWIVDKQGLMREETIGFGGDGNQWIADALAKLRE
jgi:thiol-disulfide isomerase/thioredoxin/tetratricopeptide (TPR) repeat protein